MGLKLFSAIIFLFTVGTFGYFLLNSTRYALQLRGLRKALYSIFVCGICLGFIFDQLSLSDWWELVSLVSMVIFVDLAILLTPNILKMGNAEFEYSSSVEETIKENEKIQKSTIARIGRMSEIIQDAGIIFDELKKDTSLTAEPEELQRFIEQYSETFGFAVSLWNLDANPLNDEEFKMQIRNTLEQIDAMFSLGLKENMDTYTDSLTQTEILTLLDKDCIIAPIFMTSHSFVAVLQRTMGFLLEADAIHVLNLVYLFYVYKNMVQ